MTACAHGDPGALEELFRRHSGRARQFMARMTYVPRHDLDDLLQMTFFQVYRSAHGYDGRAPVVGWIVGIAKNVVRHHVRSEASRRYALSALAHSHQVAYAACRHDVTSQEITHRVQAAFEGLPEKQRIVLLRCDLESARSSDVADALRIPEGTVWQRLHHARRRIRDALREH